MFSRFHFGIALLAATLGSVACIEHFDVGSAPGETDVIKDNIRVPSWNSKNLFAKATVSSGVLYASVFDQTAMTFTATIAVSMNYANCTPSVTTTGVIPASNRSTPIFINYNCTGIGSSTMLLSITPSGGTTVPLTFTRTRGNALDAGTTSGASNVVLTGVTAAPYAYNGATVVRNAYIDEDTFYFRLHPGLLPPNGKETIVTDAREHAVTVSCASGVCSPTFTGTLATAYTVNQGVILSLHIKYGCQQKNGESQVNVVIDMVPNTPIKFSVLKYCLYETAFSISSGTSDAKDVVNNGLVNPRWALGQNETALEPFPGMRFAHSAATVSFTFRAQGSSVTFENPVAVITNASSFGGLSPSTCVPEVTGAAATSGGLPDGGQQQLDIGFAKCAQAWGTQGGYVVVVVGLKLQSYLTVHWTFVKFHGPRPGLDITARMAVPGGNTQKVIVDGTTSAVWSTATTVPAITFGPSVVAHEFDVVVEQPALPYIVARPIVSSISISGVCSPQLTGPLTEAGQVVNSTVQRLRIVYWCKEDRKEPALSFTISETLYERESFAFSKTVHFLFGLRVGSTQHDADIFSDGAAAPPYMYNGGPPKIYYNAEKRTAHVICNYEAKGIVNVGPLSLVQNTSDYCSPLISGPAANGSILDTGECSTYFINFNCITTAGITDMQIQAATSIQDDPSEFGPILYRFIKYSFANPPGQPDAPTLTAGSGSLTATVTVPAFNGAPIKSLNVSVSSGSEPPAFQTISVPSENQLEGAEVTFTLSGLHNGKQYTVAVAALNSAGDGPFSTPVTGKPSLPWVYIIGGGIAGLLLVICIIYCAVQQCISRRRDSEAGGDALLLPGSERSGKQTAAPVHAPSAHRDMRDSVDADFALLESDEEGDRDDTVHAASDEESGTPPPTRHTRQETKDSMAYM